MPALEAISAVYMYMFITQTAVPDAALTTH